MNIPDNSKLYISLLWTTVMINMVFADVLSLYFPGAIAEIVEGAIPVAITAELLLVAAFLIEVPVIMIILTQVLRPRLCGWINIGAVVLTTVFILGGGSLKPHYILFASFEVLAMVWIGGLAWKLTRTDPQTS